LHRKPTYYLTAHPRNFSDRDRNVLSFLSPRQVRRNASIAEEIAGHLAEVEEGLASINRAIVLAGKDGKIRWMSSLARQWLREISPRNAIASEDLPPRLKQWLRDMDSKMHSQQRGFANVDATASSGFPFMIYCGKTGGGNFLMMLLRERGEIDPLTARAFGLTGRETEILFWVSEAKTNPEIATILKTSPRTVQKHVERILAKLKVENRLSAQRLAQDIRRV
jgi:DNA-binding CsgD family transcriptional regulator